MYIIYNLEKIWEFAVWLRELKPGLSNNLEWWDGEEDGRQVQEGGGHMYTYGWFTLKVKVKVAQSRQTLREPLVYTAHGILQVRILEWVAFPFSWGPSQPRDGTQVSRIAGRFFTSWVTREAQEYWSG